MPISPRLHALLIVASSLLPLTVTHAATLPADVEAFTSQRENCEHILGEEPYDAERAAEIAETARENCTNLNALWTELRARYKDDDAVLAVLGNELPLAD